MIVSFVGNNRKIQWIVWWIGVRQFLSNLAVGCSAVEWSGQNSNCVVWNAYEVKVKSTDLLSLSPPESSLRLIFWPFQSKLMFIYPKKTKTPQVEGCQRRELKKARKSKFSSRRNLFELN
jgi:hypothetical protein